MTALAAIDQVHIDGSLPDIQLVRPKTMQNRGFFYGIAGVPTEIWIRDGCEAPEFTLLHEIGHFLDFAILGRGRFFAGSPHPPPANIAAALIAWDLAIQRTSAYQQLEAMLMNGKSSLTLSSGSTITVSVDQALIRGYLLDRKELFARSYAQYITIRSLELILREQLDRERDRTPEHVYYPLQWDDDDFEPVAVTLDHLFQTLGWRT